MWPNWCRQGIAGHTPAWHRAPLLGNKSGQHFPPEQPDGAEGVLAWHPWPLAAQDELFHPQLLILRHLKGALLGTAEDEAPLQHLLKRHVDPIRLRQRPVMAQGCPIPIKP